MLITFHPSALLRVDPADKAAAYAAWIADLRHAALEFGAADPKPAVRTCAGTDERAWPFGRDPPHFQELAMTRFATAARGCLGCAAGAAAAADDMKKPDDMMKKHAMTMQDCKDHMAMAKKDGMKKDDATMKKDETAPR